MMNRFFHDPGLSPGLVTAVLWTLSNIAAGTYEQINALVDCEELWAHVLTRMSSPEIPIKREATLVVTNLITSVDDTSQLMEIVKPSHEKDDDQNITKLLIDAIKVSI